MLNNSSYALKTNLAWHLWIACIRHESILSFAAVSKHVIHSRKDIVVEFVNTFTSTFPKRNIGMTSGSRNTHEGLGHEAGNQVVLSRYLGANLPVGRKPVWITHYIIKSPVQLKLTGSIFVITLNHVQSHCMTVLNYLQEYRSQRLKLIYMVAIWFWKTTIGFSIFSSLEPHHFRLSTHTEIHFVLILKFIMESL